jgi:AcrR family transcriptional regulator
MEIQIKSADRRVKRSLRLLKQAFIELLQERGFAATSIQDITDRAEVNRGTFYAHFPDKYALLDVIVREQFQHYLTSKLPPTARWDRNNLRLLIQAVLVYSREASFCPPRETIDPLVRRAGGGSARRVSGLSALLAVLCVLLDLSLCYRLISCLCSSLIPRCCS